MIEAVSQLNCSTERSAKTYRAAVIGCGRIGSELATDPKVQGISTHAGAYTACPQTRLISVCDSLPERLTSCADRWEVAARYSDPLKMLLAEQPEIVSICTPDATHYELALAAIETESCRAIVIEKPLALSSAHGAELVQKGQSRNITLAVNYTRRYASGFGQLRQLLSSGGFGELRHVGGYYSKGTFHNGTHWFDLARFLVGEVDQVLAFDPGLEDGNDPAFDVMLRLKTGVTAFLKACAKTGYSIFEMDVLGSRGRAQITEFGHCIELFHVSESPHYSGYSTLASREQVEGGMENVLLHAVSDLVAAMESGREPRCSGRDGLAAILIAEAVRESVITGHWVSPGNHSLHPGVAEGGDTDNKYSEFVPFDKGDARRS